MNLLSHVENNLQQHASIFNDKTMNFWASTLPLLQERLGDLQWRQKVLNKCSTESKFISLNEAFEWSAPIPHNIAKKVSDNFEVNSEFSYEQKNVPQASFGHTQGQNSTSDSSTRSTNRESSLPRSTKVRERSTQDLQAVSSRDKLQSYSSNLRADVSSKFPKYLTPAIESINDDEDQFHYSASRSETYGDDEFESFAVNKAAQQIEEMPVEDDLVELLSAHSVERVDLISQMWRSNNAEARAALQSKIEELDTVIETILKAGNTRFSLQRSLTTAELSMPRMSAQTVAVGTQIGDGRTIQPYSVTPQVQPYLVPPQPVSPLIESDEVFVQSVLLDASQLVSKFTKIPPICGHQIEQYDPVSVLQSQWHCKQFTWLRQINSLNQQIFGHHQWRPNQLEIINCIMSKRDVLATMPTGGGKSLCYQVPALALCGITIVVQPLLSLIEDQVGILESLDIPVSFLGTSQTAEQARFVFEQLANPLSCKLKILFLTPEKIAQERTRSLLRRMHEARRLSMFVVDECHCVSQWGHEFRKEYKSLSCLKDLFPQVPILALTATATCCVKTDILNILQIYKNVVCFTSSFDRSNLYFGLRPKKKTCFDEIEQFISERKGQSGIIYCLSKKDCDNISKELQNRGFLCDRYHSALSTAEKTKIQSRWTQGSLQFICATIAFGMGINKADVRWIIHHSLPKSLEGFYQEAGRAGRDGEMASCILYYNYSDFWRLLKLVSKEQVDGKWIRKERSSIVEGRSRIQEMMSYAMNDIDCRHQMLLEHFGETRIGSVKCNNCDNCLDTRPTQNCDVSSICDDMIRILSEREGIKRTEFFNLLKDEVSDAAFGKYKKDKKTLIERVYIHLLRVDVVREKFLLSSHFTYSTLSLGPAYERERLKKTYPVIFKIRLEQAASVKSKNVVKKSVKSTVKKTVKKNQPPDMDSIIVIEDEVECTKVTSPVKRAPMQVLNSPKKFTFSSGYESEDLDACWIEDDDVQSIFAPTQHLPLYNQQTVVSSVADSKFDGSTDWSSNFEQAPAASRQSSDVGSLLNSTYKYASFLNRKDPYFHLRHQLIENLMDLRQEISQEECTGKRVIESLFSIQLIARMAHELPISESEIAKVNGIGAKRSEKYGTRFAFRIQSFLQKNKELEPWKNPNDIYSSVGGDAHEHPHNLQPEYLSLVTAENIYDDDEEDAFQSTTSNAPRKTFYSTFGLSSLNATHNYPPTSHV